MDERQFRAQEMLLELDNLRHKKLTFHIEQGWQYFQGLANAQSLDNPLNKNRDYMDLALLYQKYAITLERFAELHAQEMATLNDLGEIQAVLDGLKVLIDAKTEEMKATNE